MQRPDVVGRDGEVLIARGAGLTLNHEGRFAMSNDLEATARAALASGAEIPEPLFVFGIHKCGSTLLHKMVAQVCARARLSVLNLPSLAGQQGVDPRHWERDQSLVGLFQGRSIYIGFRYLPDVLLDPALQIREKRFVLLARDPRDALVSQYFSYGGRHVSHVLPKGREEEVLSQIKRTAHLDIDEYVLRQAPQLLRKMNAYRDNLDFGKGLIRRYEDIYFDKRGLLGDICAYAEMGVDPRILDRVAQANDVRPDTEDITKHIRKGTPGDYAEKLRPETIARLNDLFAATASAYGYALH